MSDDTPDTATDGREPEEEMNRCGWCDMPIPKPHKTCREVGREFYDHPCKPEQDYLYEQWMQYHDRP